MRRHRKQKIPSIYEESSERESKLLEGDLLLPTQPPDQSPPPGTPTKQDLTSADMVVLENGPDAMTCAPGTQRAVD